MTSPPYVELSFAIATPPASLKSNMLISNSGILLNMMSSIVIVDAPSAFADIKFIAPLTNNSATCANPIIGALIISVTNPNT